MYFPLSFYASMIDGFPKIWVSEKTDSHADIVREFGLRDDGRVPLYAGEIFPNPLNPSPDTSTWVLRWDSDATNGSRENPNVADALAIRREVEKVAKRYVTTGVQVVSVRGWAFGDAHQTIKSGGEGTAFGGARQTIKSGGKGWACDDAHQTIESGGKGWGFGGAHQTIESGGKGLA